MGDRCKAAQVNVLRERHPPAVDAQDSQAALYVGDGDDHFAVEAAGPAKRGVDSLRYVRRADDDYLPPADHTVHQGEQLGHYPFFDVPEYFRPLRRYGVDLVDKDDALGAFCAASSKISRSLASALAVKFVDDLRPVDPYEVQPALPRDGAGDKGLARAGRAVEKDAFGGLGNLAFEDVPVPQGQASTAP